MSDKTHHCIRCGVAIYKAGAACRDCYVTDRALCDLWRAAA